MKFRETPKAIKSLALGAFLTLAALKTGDTINFSNPEDARKGTEQNQTTEQTVNDTFIYSGKESNPDYKTIDFIGIHHHFSSDFSKPGSVYLDPALINNFFQELKNTKIDTEKVILVVEEMAEDKNQISIEDGYNNMFITPEMKSMGFRKWVKSDPRPTSSPAEVNKFHESGEKLAELMGKYLKSSRTEKSDGNGSQTLNFNLDPKISQNEIEIIKDCLKRVTIPNMDFEKNLIRVHDSLKNQGYHPVVLAGRQHILALQSPSLLEISQTTDEAVKQSEMRGIYSELSFIKGARYLAKELLGYE